MRDNGNNNNNNDNVDDNIDNDNNNNNNADDINNPVIHCWGWQEFLGRCWKCREET